MLNLPQSTEVKRPLPKAQLYKRFDWKPSQRESFDGEVSRLDFVNWITPRTLPAIAEGAEVKEIFVIEISIKSRDFDIKNITMLAKSIPQRIVYILRHSDEVRIAVFHTKLFITDWQDVNAAMLTLNGLNLDVVWEKIISFVGEFSLEQDKSLIEQIKENEERTMILQQIEALERQMRSTSQPRRQRELYSEIKKLKILL